MAAGAAAAAGGAGVAAADGAAGVEPAGNAQATAATAAVARGSGIDWARMNGIDGRNVAVVRLQSCCKHTLETAGSPSFNPQENLARRIYSDSLAT